MSTLDEYLVQLAKDLDLPEPITLEEEGVFSLPVKEGLIVKISDLNDVYQFHCPIIACPTHDVEDFFRVAMLGNLFGQGTDGAVLGLDEEGKVVTVALEIPQEAEYEEFYSQFEDFLNTIDIWQEEAINQNAKKKRDYL